eukprot:4985898-Amphidinium_carterae.1
MLPVDQERYPERTPVTSRHTECLCATRQSWVVQCMSQAGARRFTGIKPTPKNTHRVSPEGGPWSCERNFLQSRVLQTCKSMQGRSEIKCSSCQRSCQAACEANL